MAAFRRFPYGGTDNLSEKGDLSLLAERLAAAAKKRYSCRSYKDQPLECLNELEAFAEDGYEILGSFSDVRFCILRDPEASRSIMKGPWGPLPSLLLMAVRTDRPHFLEALGYAGQQVILEATALGIQTCWVSGMFSLDKATKHFPGLEKHWNVVAVSPLGYASANAKNGAKQKLFKFLSAQRGRRHGLDVIMHPTELASLPPVLVNALQAAAQAPSALNQQPWRFAIRGTELTISSKHPAPKPDHPSRLDLGIAMLEFAAAARALGEDGFWQPRQTEGNPIAAFIREP